MDWPRSLINLRYDFALSKVILYSKSCLCVYWSDDKDGLLDEKFTHSTYNLFGNFFFEIKVVEKKRDEISIFGSWETELAMNPTIHFKQTIW